MSTALKTLLCARPAVRRALARIPVRQATTAAAAQDAPKPSKQRDRGAEVAQYRSRSPSVSPAVLAPSLSPMMPPRIGDLFSEMERELESLTRSFGLPPVRGSSGASSSRDIAQYSGGFGSVDVRETPTEYIFNVDVPGLTKDDVKVRVTNDGVLEITGERKMEQEEDDPDGGYRRVERAYGAFSRRFQLPDNVDPSSIKARTENGELRLSVPKTRHTGPEVMNITVE